MKGTVIKSTGSFYDVADDTGNVFVCKIRGQLRLKTFEATNPIVVGDKVEIEFEEGTANSATIINLLERKNYIQRKSVNLSKQRHIMAANIDHAFVIASPLLPKTSTGFIDRFLATAQAYSIPGGIIFNKSDLYSEQQQQKVESLKKLYDGIGYPSVIISALNQKDISGLRDLISGKVNLFSGHSGVGKSTIINAIVPGLNIKTQNISGRHQTGIHTTTFAEMHPLPNGGFIIDTPGIREFGIIDFDKKEVSHFFPEIFSTGRNCQFNNCVHVNELNCAVIDGLLNGTISQSRYESYLSIFYNEDTFR
ncbi:MAG: ribosome small subunit-dependent GTPase A [Bacteroidia bacterium]|nr:ribosome small subunit-dependent GTPase A [Bacteroidia bacterium]